MWGVPLAGAIETTSYANTVEMWNAQVESAVSVQNMTCMPLLACSLAHAAAFKFKDGNNESEVVSGAGTVRQAMEVRKSSTGNDHRFCPAMGFLPPPAST